MQSIAARKISVVRRIESLNLGIIQILNEISVRAFRFCFVDFRPENIVSKPGYELRNELGNYERGVNLYGARE